MCRFAASGLVQTFHKFKHRGVRFASLTAGDRDSAERFLKDFAIPWPCMYDVPDETLAALGAIGKADGGRKVFPTLYVAGRDGRVLWCDQRARYEHENLTVWRANLERALEEALKAK